MGNKISIARPSFKFKRKINNDSHLAVANNEKWEEYTYTDVDTIRDANFTWLDGRRVSDDYHLFERYGEDFDRLTSLSHIIFKYILNGNTKIPLNPEMKTCLHIGTGHYIWLVEMANDHQHVQFDAFDITIKDENINSSPLPSNVNFRHGNIFNGGLPYPDEYFDYVNVRSLISWLHSDQIQYVFDEIKRVTKKNGWIEVLEIDCFIKNSTPLYEDHLGKIWRDICKQKGYDPSNIINMDKFLSREYYSDIRNYKLSIPLGKYGGKVGELYAKQFVDGSNAIATMIMDKLSMTDEEIQTYLLECIKELNLKLAYSNSYLICAKKI